MLRFSTSYSCQLRTAAGLLTYSLVRSARRRTMAICIEENASVRVLAPRYIAERTIHDFINDKITWIMQKLDQRRSFSGAQHAPSYGDGAEFLFLGRRYPLCYQPSEKKRVAIRLEKDILKVLLPWDMPCDRVEPTIAAALRIWYRNQAEKVILGRVLALGSGFDIQPSQVVIRSQKRIWGSCYPKRHKIFINWRIVMAPVDVVDYVIIHELCHLNEANHSRRFWRQVERYAPEHRESTQWLKEHAPLMRFP